MSYEAPKARLEDYEPEEFRDPSMLAQWTIWLLYAQIAVAVLALVSGLMERNTLSALGAGSYGSPDAATTAAEASDRREMLIASAQLIVYFAVGFFCLRWIHRMAYNARLRARHMEYSPGWAIGWYFIPIAYFWKPLKAMKEIWSESVRQAGAEGKESAGLLAAWWTFWVFNLIISNASFRLTMRISDIEGALIANFVTLLSDVVQIPLNLAFVMMVKRLTAMQEFAHANPDALAAVPDLRGAPW